MTSNLVELELIDEEELINQFIEEGTKVIILKSVMVRKVPDEAANS